ncbi:MAG: MgtC/SapB family protein [Burkholderiaceae bacterium]
MNPTLSLVITFVVSAALGLLVGLERERKPDTKAGVRTFTLIAVLGTLAAQLANATGSAWLMAALVLAVAASLIAAYATDPRHTAADSGTTTIVAALVVFALGAINFFGFRLLAVGLGIGTTALLYYKAEIEGFSQKITAQDVRSVLQFAAVSAIVLPLLPDRAGGPYGVLNPFRIGLMVVLIAGVSLAGYIAWRLTLARKGLLLTGLLGGLVSSTATTLAWSRHAHASPHGEAALTVILLANATMLARVLLIVAIVAPGLADAAALIFGVALLAAMPAVLWHWRRSALTAAGDGEIYRNPTQLGTALVFAAAYGGILLVTAWVSARLGAAGLYAVAAVSGLTDVDAITLSALQLHANHAVASHEAMRAVVIAVAANLVLKAVLVGVAGSPRLGVAAALGFVGPLAGLGLGLGAVSALAL